jgi:hypothetical protein
MLHVNFATRENVMGYKFCYVQNFVMYKILLYVIFF